MKGLKKIGNLKELREMARRSANSANDEIRRQVYKVFGEDSGVIVHVQSGIVRVSGYVRNKKFLRSAINLARNITGVHKLINELKKN